MKSREIEHTADLGIEVDGEDLSELFSVAGEALYGLLVDRRGILARESVTVAASADGWEELLHSWLCELLAQFNLNGFVGKYCEVTRLEPGRIEGLARGERLDLGVEVLVRHARPRLRYVEGRPTRGRRPKHTPAHRGG